MKTLIVYYSRDGSTKKAAIALAKELSADIEEVGPVARYGGFLGYFRAATDSLRGNLPAIGPAQHSPRNYALTIVAAPLWAGHAATPIRTYLNEHKGELQTLATVITRGGSSPDKAFAEIRELSGLQPVAELSLLDKEIADGSFKSQVSGFCAALDRELTD